MESRIDAAVAQTKEACAQEKRGVERELVRIQMSMEMMSGESSQSLNP
jgi:hypothetical protein